MIDLDLIKDKIIKPESLLDLGCGAGEGAEQWWDFFRDVKRKIGIDLWQPNLTKMKEKYPDGEFICMDMRKIDEVFEPKSFDLILCSHAIEHIPKKDGYELIKKMEKIAKKQIIIVTPNGFVFQPKGENPYEEHKSGWEKEEFEHLEFEVYLQTYDINHLVAIKCLE